MQRFEMSPGTTIAALAQLVPGSYVRVTDGVANPRNSHRGLSTKDLVGIQPWALYSQEEVEATDASRSTSVAITCGQPRRTRARSFSRPRKGHPSPIPTYAAAS